MAADDTSRPYRSAIRAEQAATTRRRVLLAVADEVTAVGYDRATLPRIAARAGVSVETVKAQGPKRDLLVRAFEVVFAGDEGDRTLEERIAAAAVPADDVHALLRVTGTVVADAYARSVRLWEAFVAAARTDADVQAAFDAMRARRRASVRATVAELARRGMPVAGDVDEVVDQATLVYSHEAWRHLVEDCGWSTERYVAWAVALAVAMLTGGPYPTPVPAG
ncbi:TetR family transcriptional regulator [Cellulomonas sp. NPDC057328]|uniref:TetR family transcriptional regulator n=1 Tax=Cellulomonas sp. NPDC057328 TaxID=3346101 RepID=UPI0036453EC2